MRGPVAVVNRAISRTDIPPGAWVQNAGGTAGLGLKVAAQIFSPGLSWRTEFIRQYVFAFQATLAGWHTHGIGGFDRERLRNDLGVPADHALEAVIAVGRQGDKSLLTEALHNLHRRFPARAAQARSAAKQARSVEDLFRSTRSSNK